MAIIARFPIAITSIWATTDRPRFESAADPVAEYLYSSALSAAAPVFEKYRQKERERWIAEFSEPVLRTFGLCQLGGSNSDLPSAMAEVVCRDLVCNWCSGIATEVERAAPRLSETIVRIAEGRGWVSYLNI